MKKLLLAVSVVILAAACGPMRHAVHVEMRYPSKAGIDLIGKNVSVVYLENDNHVSTEFAKGIADGFAYSLEQDCGTGEGSVGIYSMRQKPGVVYSEKDSLISLLVETDADVIFLLDTLSVGAISMGGSSRVAAPTSKDSAYLSTGSLPFKMKLYCLDAMDKNERVRSFNGSSVAAPHAYSDGKQQSGTLIDRAVSSLEEVGFEAGRLISESFKSQWKHEQFSIVYLDGEKWYKAVDYAEQYYWKDAMDIWLGLLDTNDLLKRSCAAYNLAVACYMLGDYGLSEEWLDRSDTDNKLPVSDTLRKRIEQRK